MFIEVALSNMSYSLYPTFFFLLKELLPFTTAERPRMSPQGGYQASNSWDAVFGAVLLGLQDKQFCCNWPGGSENSSICL